MVKVSAIVPVYNPGEDIDDCIESLLDQSLPPDEYEVIFVDDGSTDGTGARLDHLAEKHAHVRVEHIPNSGWPGRPRNVGTDMARGEFVYFVDNDDWVGSEALERMYSVAVRDDADVVVGKVVGHGKRVARALFAENRSGVTIEWPPLLGLLTPHKLFRKSFLAEHGIRFPEGRRRLEDHVFVVHAYFHTHAISILADYPCYHWMRRDRGEANVSLGGFEPKGYFENLREVLDLVEHHTEPGPLRRRLLAHWYRDKMLGRVGGRYHPGRDPAFRRALYDEVRALAVERFDAEVDAWLPQNLRLRSHLLREGTFESLEALGEWEAQLRAVVTVVKPRRKQDSTFVLPFEARLVIGDEGAPLSFERRGGRIFMVPPALPDAVPDRALEVTDDVFNSNCRLTIRSRADRAEFALPSGEVDVLLEDVPGGMTPVISASARIVPGKAAAGAPPAAGRWEVLGSVTVVGFHASGAARKAGAEKPYAVRIDELGAVKKKKRQRQRQEPPPSLRARVARVFRRARGGRRATASG